MPKPVRAKDVAAYILGKQGPMNTWKLQKLCYYAQAWSLVWDDAPLFRDRIEAWAGGPVAPTLYSWHRGRFFVEAPPPGSDPGKLDTDQRETVDAVLAGYGPLQGAELSQLTHMELPWQYARRRAGLLPGERGKSRIPLDVMADYYGGIYSAQETQEASA